VVSGNLRLLFELMWQPMAAIKQLRDRAPVGFAVIAAWVATALYLLVALPLLAYAQEGVGLVALAQVPSAPVRPVRLWWAGSLYQAAMWGLMAVLFLAVVYVPVAVFIANLFERRASYALVIREDFAATAACALASWAVSLLVALLPAIIIGWQSARLPSLAATGYLVLLGVMPLPIFAALMTITLGTIFRIRWGAAVVATVVSFFSLAGLPLLLQVFTFVCASPFLLLLLVFLLRDRIGDLMSAQRARQSFKQNLEAATLNPADASAHYNLGLIYQQRGEYDAAVASFRRAIEIDPQDADAHYQLGRIARERGQPAEAIKYFETVVRLAPAHSQHEVWREIALVYFAAGQHRDALEMLDRFLASRPSDAQGRYWRGLTLAHLGRADEAVEEMQTCIESVRTAPAYKYRTERRWLQLAQNFLREREV
jgi:tetratricopeptide (TPR) repeat protein